MARFGIAIIVFALGFLPAKAWPQHHHHHHQQQTIRYPRVYGATGHLYGPTQAYYQYQRQYGHPWNGQGGITAPATVGTGYRYTNGYPAGGLSYGYLAYQACGGFGLGYGGAIVAPGYNPFPSYTPAVPTLIYSTPPGLGYNPALQNALVQTNPAWNQPLNLPAAAAANMPPPPSTAEAKLKSVRAQAQGDMWFKQQEFHKAYDRYKAAVSEAPDRGAAHLRLAICYATLGHFDLAVRQLKVGLASDPKLAAEAEPLKKIYGAQNSIPQTAMLNRATLWTKEDIRDPDRLFLLGTLLYLEGDERASIPLRTGMELQGGGDHFRSFLKAAQNQAIKDTKQADAAPHPQVIDQNPPAQTNPQNPGDGSLPPLPAPPSNAPGNLPQNPAPLVPLR